MIGHLFIVMAGRRTDCCVLLCAILLAHSTPGLTTTNPSECSQSIVADRPVLISSNNGSTPLHCSYVITVPPDTLPDHVFQVSLLAFSMGRRSDEGCAGGWARLGSSLYCGGPTSPGTFLLFPTSKHHSHLDLELNPGIEHQFQARVELLPRLTLQEKHPEMILATPGEPVRFTECDRVYNCLEYPGYCQITSPNFPGAYQRPMNCSYHLKSPEPGIVIGGRHELFEVGDGHKITENCDFDDYIAIYDGGELISKFCGKGRKFPRIISKTSDIIIQFVATNTGLPAKGFVLSVERSPPHMPEQVQCSQTIKVGAAIQQVRSPHHWLAPDSHCSYTLATKQGKQIWLLITNLKTRSNCLETDDYISIYEGSDLIVKYCKQNQIINPIVSKSNQLRIVYNSPNGTLDATSKFYFTARFTSVNTIETGEHVENSWCDMIFSTKLSGPFTLLNPKDLILHMKNSSQNLICKYHFVAPESYTVRLQLDHTSFEPLHRCSSVIDACDLQNYDKILITEKIDSQILGCECGARKHAQIFHSKGSEMIVTLSLNLNYDLVNTSLKYSPELYQFQGRYQFAPPNEDNLHCGNYIKTNDTLEFPLNRNMFINTPILCHWKLNNINLSLLKLNHYNLSSDCKNNLIIIKYNYKELKLCSKDHFNPHKLIHFNDYYNESDVHIYLLANKGHPHLIVSWQTSQEQSEEIPTETNECYGALTLSLFMAAAAICTMTVVLAVALVVWRYRESVWFTWRTVGPQRYSSVTRRRAFW